MKFTPLLALSLLAACGSDDRETLGTFDMNKRMILAGIGSLPATETTDTWSCPLFAIGQPVAGETDDEPCPCRGSATVHRASNRTDAALLQFSLQQCAHASIVEEAHDILDWWVPESSHGRLLKDLERPGGDEQRPEHRKVEATHIYGDRTVEMTWTRDVFRAADGTEQPGDTESIFVAVRPRKRGDREQVRATTEPVISPTPRCP
jgi:hypothetical protein